MVVLQVTISTTIKSASSNNDISSNDKKLEKVKNVKLGKLSDLLSITKAKIEIKTKMKIEALEELKGVVREFQVEDKMKRKKNYLQCEDA